MASVLQALNLYPQSRFWRVRSAPSVSNIAGGIATILVIVAMTVYSISQLVLVFDKTSLTFNNL